MWYAMWFALLSWAALYWAARFAEVIARDYLHRGRIPGRDILAWVAIPAAVIMFWGREAIHRSFFWGRRETEWVGIGLAATFSVGFALLKATTYIKKANEALRLLEKKYPTNLRAERTADPQKIRVTSFRSFDFDKIVNLASKGLTPDDIVASYGSGPSSSTNLYAFDEWPGIEKYLPTDSTQSTDE